MNWGRSTNNDSIQTPPPHLPTSSTQERDPLLGMDTYTRPSQELPYISGDSHEIMASKTDTSGRSEHQISVWFGQSENHLSDPCPPSLGRADYDSDIAGNPEEACQLSLNPDQSLQVFTEYQQGISQYNQSFATQSQVPTGSIQPAVPSSQQTTPLTTQSQVPTESIQPTVPSVQQTTPLTAQSQVLTASNQSTVPSAQQTASHFPVQSLMLPSGDESATSGLMDENLFAKLEEFQEERFNNWPAAPPRFKVQEGKQSGVVVTKDYVMAKPKKPITFELHGCQIGQAVQITARYTSENDKLKPVRPCKKHQGEKEIPKESSFYVTSHKSRFEMKDEHPYIILPIDKLNPDGILTFSVASLCWSSCHSRNEIELILQLVKDSDVILEDSFKMHFHENVRRDHNDMLKRKGLLKESKEGCKPLEKRARKNSPTPRDLETGIKIGGKKMRTDPTNTDHETEENVGNRRPKEECPTPGPSQVQDVLGEGSLNANAPVMCRMQNDEYAMYGALMAQKLRSLSERDTFLKAQHEINNIIYKAETGQL